MRRAVLCIVRRTRTGELSVACRFLPENESGEKHTYVEHARLDCLRAYFGIRIPQDQVYSCIAEPQPPAFVIDASDVHRERVEIASREFLCRPQIERDAKVPFVADEECCSVRTDLLTPLARSACCAVTAGPGDARAESVT